ncbi:epidermal growth factor-like protein 7 [Gigantopelta aegis]|uniref:epidermal growth factor-like protein 7 n=1 Tax=Gigantopelta aegis TaxID=1735272 RepID=UPI001B88DFAF|nr:epidermal growth factor-like protein 7 [Gigantopelta aegis]
MGTNVVTLLFLATFVTVCYGWSGHVCYRRESDFVTVRVCAYKTWFGCTNWTYRRVERYRYVPYCCSGWKGTPGNPTNCVVAICRPNCRNGGVCDRPGHCKCPSGRDGYRCDGQ